MIRYIFLFFIIFIGSVNSIYAQHAALTRYWNFDDEGQDMKGILDDFSGDLKFSNGITRKGLDLSESNVFLEIKDGVDLMTDFTLVFWFNPKDLTGTQTLFYQFRQIPGDYNIRNFIRLDIENETFVFKSEKGRFNLKHIDLKANSWYNISYMFDGKYTKLYLQGKLIYCTDEVIYFHEKPVYQVNNRLFIGRSHTEKSQFQGVVDELKVFQAAIKENEIIAIFDEYKDNTAIGYVEDETLNKINISFEKPADLLTDEIIFVESYEVLEPLIVRTTSVILEYYQIMGNDKTQMVITHNDEILDKPYHLLKEKQSTRIPIKIGNENSLTFEGFQLKRNRKCRVRVNIKSGNNIIASYDIDLDKNNVVLPIAYLREKDENSKSHKIITVNSKNIKIQVKDNSKVDGDVITIKQEGITLLDNYMLTEELKTIDVTLKENTQTEFTFVPNDMGKASGENTALVLILVDDKIIYDFSLRSIDVNRPAKLTIIHEDFQ
jgi:hypothetical protein